jgi:hypothetical protein
LTLSTIYRWKKANKATLASVAGRDAARMRFHSLCESGIIATAQVHPA